MAIGQNLHFWAPSNCLQVDASRRKLMQVGVQTKTQARASQNLHRLASSFEQGLMSVQRPQASQSDYLRVLFRKLWGSCGLNGYFKAENTSFQTLSKWLIFQISWQLLSSKIKFYTSLSLLCSLFFILKPLKRVLGAVVWCGGWSEDYTRLASKVTSAADYP